MDEEREMKRNKRKSFIKIIAIALSIIFAIFLNTFSWFTRNKETGTTGMSVKTSNFPFYITTKGSAIRNNEISAGDWPEYNTGTAVTLHDTSDLVSEYYTDESLRLRFTPANGSVGVGPKSTAALNLFVVPNTDDSFDVKITMDIVSFAEIPKMDSDGNILYKKDENDQDILDNDRNKIIDTEIIEIKNAGDFAKKANAVHNRGIAEKAAEYVKAAGHLRSHILFFGSAESNPTVSGYYFSDPYTTRTATKTVGSNNMGKAVPVPIYWMWTNTLGQIALPDSRDNLRSGLPILADINTTDKSKITAYLKENKNDIFANCDENTEGYITAVTSPTEDTARLKTAFNNLSTGYNLADNAVGTKIAYFMIELKIEKG